MAIGYASASPKYAFADEVKSDSAADEPCPEGNINVDLPQAPAGKASTMVITIDENCQPVYGPIKFVAPDEANVESNDKNVVAGSFDEVRVSTLSLDPSLGADYAPLAGGSTCFTAFLRLNDVVGLQLNKVYGNVCWSWSGTIVTSASAGGGWQAHSEAPVFPGWGAINPWNAQTGGCAGCSYISFRQHTEFNYRGVFDPSGTLYYNTIEVNEYLYGAGSRACSFSFVYRNWFPGWNTATGC
jgi:hypothetical protein